MNDIDPLLHEAMVKVKGPTDLHPSIGDVHRRARRHYRRRMAATAGAVVCTGVATAALIVRRDSTDLAVSSSTDPTEADANVTPTTYLPAFGVSTTIVVPSLQTIDASFVWGALANLQIDPSAAGLLYPSDSIDVDTMPTAEMFGCTTQECRAMFNYVVWHEIAHVLGFFDVAQMQAVNNGRDFGQSPHAGDVLQSAYPPYEGGVPTTVAEFPPAAVTTPVDPANEPPTTISLFDGVMLVDAGAPAGALEDAYGRLDGYNRTIVLGSGKTVAQTKLMPIGDNVALATAVGGLLGVDGFDTWDPSFLATPIQGMVAVVIGPDYYDRVANASSIITVATTTTSNP